jgi:hypothetical protein
MGHQERAPSGPGVNGSVGVAYLDAMKQLMKNFGRELAFRGGRDLVCWGFS